VTAIGEARADVRAGRIGVVPPHLRDAHYASAKQFGHGVDYLYAHDAPHGIAAQQYLPDDLIGADYYRPTGHGNEASVTERLKRINELLGQNGGSEANR
jgi:putative ATPase